MKLKKLLISIVCAAVAGLSLFAFAGCTQNGNELPRGKFYTLQEAYNASYIDSNELREIARYYNGGACYQKLDDQTELLIKQTIVFDLKNDAHSPEPNATVEDVDIVKYYGEYNKCHVVTIDSVFWSYPTDAVNDIKVVGVVTFIVKSHLSTLIWIPEDATPKTNNQTGEAKGSFISLQSAYDDGLITEKDIQAISYRRWNAVCVVAEDETDWTNSDNWIKIDYTPPMEMGELSESVEADILLSYYNLYNKRFFDKDGNKKGGVEDLSVKYYGEYNGLYAVQIESRLWSYTLDMVVERYGNTVLSQTRCEVEIFKMN